MTDATRPLLALPRNASLCEWCDAPIPAYGSDTCPACKALFDGCWDAEKDFMRRLSSLAGSLIWDWARDWSHLPPEELKSTFTFPLEGLVDGIDTKPLQALFDVAYAAAKGARP